MTVKEYLNAQKKKLTDFKRFTVPFALEVRSTVAIQTDRIFNKGLLSSGDKIGKYNTTEPLYVNPKTSAGKKFTPEGKPIEVVVKKKIKKLRSFNKTLQIDKTTGRKTILADRKTKWFPSYAEYRKTIGRQIAFVDLRLSGDFFQDFANSKTTQAAKPVKISDTQYNVELKRDINTKKLEGLTDKYGKFANLTKKERADFFKRLDISFQLALEK